MINLGRFRIWYADNGPSSTLCSSRRLSSGFEALEKRELLANWCVAPDGLSSNAGTLEAPWDIESALVNTADVQPGDTIWLRGGTYYHPDRSSGTRGYSFNLQGSAEAPVTVRAYSSERATIDGGLHTSGIPRHMRIQDLEIIVSENYMQPRTSSQSGSSPTDLNRPWGGINLYAGYDIKLVNNVVHANTGNGIGFWGSVSGDSELSGNIIYDNGWIGPDRHHGHGIYAQNPNSPPDHPDWKHIQDNILYDNYSFNAQLYGSSIAYVDRFRVARNISYAGAMTDDGRFLIGGGRPSEEIMAIDNVGYRSSLQVGYGGPGDDAVVAGNTTLLAGVNIFPGYANLTAEDNVQWHLGDSSPTGPLVFLNLNKYDSNRANLAIMALQGETTAELDLSELLEIGDTFHLRDPADFYGDSVYVGTYTGSPVSVPLTGEFTTYVVLKNGQTGGPPVSTPHDSIPKARDDAYSTAIDTAIDVGASGVLGNDTDADGDTLSAILVTPPSYGTVDLNSNGAFTYTPNAGFHGADGFAYRVNDGTDFSSIATAAIQVGPLLQTWAIDFNDYDILSYGGSEQDIEGSVTVEDNGLTLHMAGNRWKAIELPIYVGENTILEFDFRSTNEGEIHGIGFDTDVSVGEDQTFKLYGTQDWGLSDFANYADTAPNTKHYQIPVGQFYTGLMRYLFFANDHDVDSPTAESVFSNVRVYEVGSGSPPVANHDGQVTADQGTPVTIYVLSNDSDDDGNIDPTTVAIAKTPYHGTANVNADGTVTYTPDAEYHGTDTFRYVVQDTEGARSNEASVTVAVVGTGTVDPDDPDATEPHLKGGSRRVFYNNSAWDGNDALSGATDDGVVASDKQALLPGGTATFANYTSYSRGINGIMVDVAGMQGMPTSDDFEFKVGNSDSPSGWDDAPEPTSITVRPGEGVDGSDRVTLIWPDGVIRKQWLQVTVLPGGNIGLAQPDVFYFGNAVGESGNSAIDAKVNAFDVLGARDNQRTFFDPAPIDFPFDFDRNKKVNVLDMFIARNNMTHFINAVKLITTPLGGEAASKESSSADVSAEALDWLYELEPANAEKDGLGNLDLRQRVTEIDSLLAGRQVP